MPCSSVASILLYCGINSPLKFINIGSHLLALLEMKVLDLPEGQRGCLSLSESLRLSQELNSVLGEELLTV